MERKGIPTARRRGGVATAAEIRRENDSRILNRVDRRFPRETGQSQPTDRDPFCGLPDSSRHTP